MTAQQVADKTGKSLSENLVVIVLVGVFMASFIFYFFKQEGQLTRAGFENVRNVFSARVNAIHAQWFMDMQPRFVEIESSLVQPKGEKLRVSVNKAGWVDVDNSGLVCQKIWHFVMETPLVFMKQPIAAVLIESQGNHVLRYCQYSLPSGEFFTYQSGKGIVGAFKLAHKL